MHQQAVQTTTPLQYSALRRRWPWKPYLLGVATVPAIYFLSYVLLRLSGVYYPFFNMGSWDIDGSTHVYVLDVAFVPATLIEVDVQNRLRWLQEPTGG